LGIHTYTGREWDKEPGLYYYRARYYDPMEGRFIAKDSIGFRGGINLYGYVGQNPINYSDPIGLKPGDVFPSVELAATDAIMYAT
jgi:RHS repeat-associated protein